MPSRGSEAPKASTAGSGSPASSSQPSPTSSPSSFEPRDGAPTVHNDVDRLSYYLGRLEKAAALPASEQGADVKGFLRHQQLLDEAMRFFLEEFEVVVADGMPQITPQLDAWAAPYLARIVAAQVACPLDGYSFFKKQPDIPPTLCLVFLPFMVVCDVEGGGMQAMYSPDVEVQPEVMCVIKAAAAAVVLLAVVMKEQRQMAVQLPSVHGLASKVIQCLEGRSVAGRLRPELARFDHSGGSSSSSSGSSQGPLLPFEQLLFAAYLVRWQANLAMLMEPLQELLPAGMEAALQENASGGQRMAELLPDAPLGWFAQSGALMALGRPQEAWACMERCRQVADAHNDGLMAGTACIKLCTLLEQGGAGPFTLRRYKGYYSEAREYEKTFRRWAPSSLLRMFDGTAIPAKQQLAKAREHGLSMDDWIAPSTAGLLQQSPEERQEVCQALLEHARCAACGHVGVGLMRCSACKSVSYCSSACQKEDWRKHKAACASLAAAHGGRHQRRS